MSDEAGQDIDKLAKSLNTNKSVRIYSFSFKRAESLLKDRLREMACTNRGYYFRITTYADINSALQKIVQVGNRPLRGQTVTPTWSNAYKDLGEIGMVVTVTLPIVVDTSMSQLRITGHLHNSQYEVSLLGIVGLDFKASRIVRMSLGLLPLQCNMMIVNNKGYPIFHPRIFQYSYEHVNVKIDQFQFTDSNKQHLKDLERAMIDKNKTHIIFKSFINSPSTCGFTHHGTDWYQELGYHIFPLENTPFSIAVIWTNHPHQFLHKAKTLEISKINEILTNWKTNGTIYMDIENNACKIQQYLDAGSGLFTWEPDNTCSTFIFSVFTDIYLSQYLSPAFKFGSSKSLTVVTHFMTTYNGITFYSNRNWTNDNYTQKGFQDFAQFKKALRDMADAELILTIPNRGGPEKGHGKKSGIYDTLFLIKPIKLQVSNTTVQVGVAGIEVELKTFKTAIFGDRARKYIKILVDENGMIVLSHPGNLVGFLGSKYSSLFRILSRKNIYTRINYTECIHKCTKIQTTTQPPSSDAFSPHHLSLFSYTKYLLRILLLYLQLLLQPGWAHTQHAAKSVMKDPLVYGRTTTECCKQFDQYQRNFTFQSSLTIETWCGCTSRVTVSAVPKTNLILVSDRTPDCLCANNAIEIDKGTPAQVMTNICNIDSYTDYYRSFQSCILGDHNDTACDGATSSTLSLVLVAAASTYCLYFL